MVSTRLTPENLNKTKKKQSPIAEREYKGREEKGYSGITWSHGYETWKV